MSALCILLGGCRSAAVTDPDTAPAPGDLSISGPESESYLLEPAQYLRVYAAAVEVLRDGGFRIARNDYRFGTITTFPKESPTAAEFWIDDATTADQRRADTLNAQQRRVAIRITKLEDANYELTAEVLIEIRRDPARYLTHSATGRLTAEYAATPTHLSERGITGPYTQVLSRDPQLEARLIRAIRERANRP